MFRMVQIMGLLAGEVVDGRAVAEPGGVLAGQLAGLGAEDWHGE